jgi:hypothetical protein
MPADDLIAELEGAATELIGFSDFRFSEMAREDLAAFREDRQREQLARAWSVPERYLERAEEFVVFSAFVHAYLSPVLTARGVLELFLDVGGSDYSVIQFSRFGESAPFDMQANGEVLGRFRGHTTNMIRALESMGREIFGQRFRTADFWDGEEEER